MKITRHVVIAKDNHQMSFVFPVVGGFLTKAFTLKGSIGEMVKVEIDTDKLTFQQVMPCMEIPLTQGMKAIIDHADYELVSQVKWHYAAARGVAINCTWRGNPKAISMQRFIMRPKKGEVVAHISENKLDNRRCNLYIRTLTGPYAGITSNGKGQWNSVAVVNGVTHYLGTFKTKEEARDVRYKELTRLRELMRPRRVR